MSKAIFVNLPVKDVANARDFYVKMGFSVNKEYSNNDATFIVVDQNIHLILLTHAFFKASSLRDVADTASVREVSVAIQLDDRDAVNKAVDAAVAAGATEEGEVMDDEIIYSRGVRDLDGHRLDINCLKK